MRKKRIIKKLKKSIAKGLGIPQKELFKPLEESTYFERARIVQQFAIDVVRDGLEKKFKEKYPQYNEYEIVLGG